MNRFYFWYVAFGDGKVNKKFIFKGEIYIFIAFEMFKYTEVKYTLYF